MTFYYCYVSKYGQKNNWLQSANNIDPVWSQVIVAQLEALNPWLYLEFELFSFKTC